MLNVKNISYSFNESVSPLLKDISFKIDSGQMLAVMGLNGAGKTTLMRIMSRYLKPISGEIFLNDKGLGEYASKELAREISFVPQDFPTEFPFTVFDFVMMGRFCWQEGLFNSKEDRDKVHDVLERLNLRELEGRVVSSLSGGERQRVLLARALVQESKIILLDEPANHLDIKNKMEILKIIHQENRSGQKTIIAVMHDFHDAKKYFDSVLLIKDGGIAFNGSVSEGFTSEILRSVFGVDVLSEVNL